MPKDDYAVQSEGATTLQALSDQETADSLFLQPGSYGRWREADQPLFAAGLHVHRREEDVAGDLPFHYSDKGHDGHVLLMEGLHQIGLRGLPERTLVESAHGVSVAGLFLANVRFNQVAFSGG